MEDLENSKEFKLTIFDEILNQVIGFAKEVLQDSNCDFTELLLSAPELIFTFSSKEVVSSVAKVVND